MKKVLLFITCSFCYLSFIYGQKYSDRGPENNYQSKDNPYYWKNRTPFEGYWQQDVHYKINAVLDDSTNIITGDEQLTYYNNSPDTLYFVYFHLYQNAFQPGSYLDNLQENNYAHSHYGKYEKAGLGIAINEMKSNGEELKTKLDNTILKVFLDRPIYPNTSKAFQIKFKTYYDSGSTRRRMKKYKAWQFTHYNGCQWYPKICVYDRKFDWETDQHLNREFYGDFGTFDVDLTFASNYIVEATGVLQNEKEVLPDTLKQKLDIYNFKDKKWEEKPSVITPAKKGETKTWKYHAENVHDFAFTADPTYRIHDTIIYPGRKNGEGVRCVAIVQEPHASGWQNASDYLAKIIATYSRDFGVFEYPKIVIADAADGMEYPMLTLDGGKDPDYHYLLAHEVGHNWFYGMLGNNETYRAMMDEGFTQFLTAWGLEAIDGDTIIQERVKNWYARKFTVLTNPRDRACYNGYLQDAIQFNDEQLNTHSDAFNGAIGQGGGYRHVYMKTSTMLYSLQYVLGDSVFLTAMKHYVAQWKFAHPYPEDFRNSIIHFTHVDLNWFFDEWIETTKNIDYKLGCIRKVKLPDQYVIKLKRKGRMQMPVDLRVISKKDSVYDFTIPNTWYEKKSDDDKSMLPIASYIVLPKWYGWDKLEPTYNAMVTIPGGIKNVIIDPSNRLADINMMDNRKKDKAEFRFDSHIYPPMSWEKYRLYMRPDVWWNAYDGFKIGFNLNGNYMNVKNNFSLSAWLNTRLAQGGATYGLTPEVEKKASWFNYRVVYSDAIDKVIRKGTIYAQSEWLDGLALEKVGLSKQFGNNFTADVNVKGFTRPMTDWTNYLLYPGEWSSVWQKGHKVNASINLSLTYTYNHDAYSGYLTGHLRSSAVGTSFDYHYFELTSVLKPSVWKLDFRTRVYGRIGTGNNIPSESALFFSGGNPEEMMDNKYYRSVGFAPPTWVGAYGADINHVQFTGGLNMRGYAGYLVPENDKTGAQQLLYKGNSGASVNAEMDFNRIVKVKNKFLKEYFNLNTYLFGDAGTMGFVNGANQYELSAIRLDAGAGVAFTIKKWGPLQGIKPLTLRFDVPFYVSNATAVSPNNLAFRWVVGIGRAF